MRFISLIFIVLLAIINKSFGTEIGYSRSQSSTSASDRFQIGQKINQQHKLGLSVSLSKDTTGTVEDSKTASYKLSYRYKFLDPLVLVTLEGKRTDDSYFYEGVGGALKVGFNIAKINLDKETTLETRLSVRGDVQNKIYTKERSENLGIRTVTVGLDQDLYKGLAIGLSYSSISYSSNGVQTKQALNSVTIGTSDITNYLSYVSKSTLSGYVEYTYDDFITLGLSQSRDVPYFSTSTKSTTNEIYLDYQAFDFLGINASYSQGKTEGSTTNSDTWSAGLLFNF